MTCEILCRFLGIREFHSGKLEISGEINISWGILSGYKEKR